MDLEDYLSGSRDFAHIDIYKVALLSRAKREGTAVDPIDIWAGLSHPGSPLRPLHSIAQCLLSICPNSASCEQTLTLIAELKMYIHEEHARNNVVKKQLKRRYSVDEEEVFSATEMMHSVPTTDSFTPIAISELLDYSRAEEWLGSFYKTAIRGLDAELELYELLDLDAEGIEDPEFPQVDDVLAE
ncbi:uncharacterized protein F5147DRAFT_769074 [Suillus discolor]|uniref:Uncharacterized protein n=1 Tax=Suillus discolor TaxID=1912936 RepID=A0A9P7FG78_9AGAM|nr:uncharacterized protein F5147DRAFT_769074 [Suillus discolor]KAG2116713.1 hypothetical protein F5147DRAFT_769074 [Suillus discolor]